MPAPVEAAPSGKSGVIEGPVFGAATADELDPDLEAPAAEPDTQPDVEPEAKTWVPVQRETEPEPEPVVEAEPEPEPEPVAEAEPEPEPEPEPEAKAEEFASSAPTVRQQPEEPTRVEPAAPRAAGAAAVVPPPPGSGSPARRTGLLVGGVAAALVVALLVWLAVKTDGSAPDTQGTGATQTTGAAAAPVPSAPGTSAGESGGQGSSAPAGSTGNPSTPAAEPPAGTASGKLPPLPPGWVDYHDPTGFSVYVPQGWNKSMDGTMVYFRGNNRTLGIDQTGKPNMDPVADWTQQEKSRGGSYYKNYSRVGIRPVDNYFVVAADWEFIYGNKQHVNNRGVVTSDHQAYGIWWATADSDWANARGDLDIVFASFRPRP
ncbi:hypothetical protein ABT369_44655 [Dactylosporangium sp. NPDC000244]|uniref:hypothetical protein n=1 Tax=Dactylosporangium sp. NPDC000244 TaxID=3154365 RepID=UPI003329A53B